MDLVANTLVQNDSKMFLSAGNYDFSLFFEKGERHKNLRFL